MALVFARGRAAAEFDLCPAAAPNLGPRRQVRVGCFSPAGSTMLRGLIWCCHVLIMGLPAGTAGLKRHRSITMEFAVGAGRRDGRLAARCRLVRAGRPLGPAVPDALAGPFFRSARPD